MAEGTGRAPSVDLRQRARLLLVVLTVLRLRVPSGSAPPILTTLHAWLDTWTGIGHVATGMARQGYDLQLTRYGDEGWRATFYPAGRAHSITAAVGSAWERAPWRAVQGAAWETLRKTDAVA